MYTFVLTLHIILSILLTLLILMQPGKGADVSSAFGGGAASQLFGAAGPGNFLTRGTGLLAGLFMVTSVTLALYSTSGSGALDDLEGEDVGEEGGGFGNSTPPADNSLPPLVPATAPTEAPPIAPAGGGEVAPGGATPAPAEGAPAEGTAPVVPAEGAAPAAPAEAAPVEPKPAGTP